ncbi:MAG: SAM-dependent methyltransferase [Bacteroidota bacterium]
MEQKRYEVEASTLFSESKIWQLNRDYYNKEGIKAWQTGTVPHYLTSNAMVGKTYAELIFGILKDLGRMGKVHEKVYILEMGAGHGRLCFHILLQLEKLLRTALIPLPNYCYILSDIAEDNLLFLEEHPQFLEFLEKGNLDVAFFDSSQSKKIRLRKSGIDIHPQSLTQPLITLANYLFDSLPVDLYQIKEDQLHACSVSLSSKHNPDELNEADLLEELEIDFQKKELGAASKVYEDPVLNEILNEYREKLQDSFLFFPEKSLSCLKNLKELSQMGLILISMDKGYHNLHDLEGKEEPRMVTHGSMSFWVNYHAFASYCKKIGGKALLPTGSSFRLELPLMLFLEEGDSFVETQVAYQRFVNDFGPDDFNSLKRFSLKGLEKANISELLALMRFGVYDSTLFKNILPTLKILSGRVTFNERAHLARTMHKVWENYFIIHEPQDLAFEMASIFYTLGFYQDSLVFFKYSIQEFGYSPDTYFNSALCYYQLREDKLFLKTVKAAKQAYPEFEKFSELDRLDLSA